MFGELLIVIQRKLLVDDDVKELVTLYGKLHRPVGSDTLSRWIKDDLKLSRTDINVFAAHIYRLPCRF